MLFLIGVLSLIGFVVFCYFYIKYKIRHLSKNYFGENSLKDIMEQARLEDEETPKSLSSMDRLYVEQIHHDFPELSIPELKRMGESLILECFLAIEKGNSTSISYGKAKQFVEWQLQQLGNQTVHYQNFHIHNTVISKYQKNSRMATICVGCSFEYFYQKDGENSKKVQDRAKIEFIYVIDDSKLMDDEKLIGLNCPNCGSPIHSLGEKKCSYCGTGVIELVKRVWTVNDISFY